MKKKKEQQKKSISKILKRVLIVLFVIAAIAFIVIAVVSFKAYFKDGDKAATFALKNNGITYTKDSGGLTLHSGEEIEVFILKGDGEYQVDISANVNNENDVNFTVGSEPFKWSDTAGKKFTSGFKITQTNGGFKIEYNSLTDIVSSAYQGRSVKIDEAFCDLELFKLTVTCGEGGISLTFAIYRSKIEIDPDEIIFAKGVKAC